MSLKDDILNGSALASEITAGPPVANPQLVAMIEQTLAEVKAGRITSVAILGAGPMGQLSWPIFGMQGCELYTAAGLLQKHIEEAMMGNAKPAGRILRMS